MAAACQHPGPGVRGEEAFAALPGDDVIAQPMVQWTRGVTVAASAEAVWPWLVQAGRGRAGWYTPRWVDTIVEPTLFRTSTATPNVAWSSLAVVSAWGVAAALVATRLLRAHPRTGRRTEPTAPAAAPG